MNKITSKLNANDNKQLVLAKNLKTLTNHSDKQQQDEKSQTDSILEYVRQRMIDPCKVVPGQPINYDAEKLSAYLNPVYPGSCTELINSTEWLNKYGLRINRLTFENILKMIGFKQNIGSFLFRNLFMKRIIVFNQPSSIFITSNRIFESIQAKHFLKILKRTFSSNSIEQWSCLQCINSSY